MICLYCNKTLKESPYVIKPRFPPLKQPFECLKCSNSNCDVCFYEEEYFNFGTIPINLIKKLVEIKFEVNNKKLYAYPATKRIIIYENNKILMNMLYDIDALTPIKSLEIINKFSKLKAFL